MKKSDLTLMQLTELMGQTKLAEGRTERVTVWYRYGINKYCRWLAEKGHQPTLAHFTLELVREYLRDLRTMEAFSDHPTVANAGRLLSDHTINTYARTLRGFSSWLYAEQYTTEPILGRLKMPSTTKKVQDILSHEEITKIIASLNPRTEIGARDQAIFILMLDTGMRAGELCGLKLSNLNLEQGYALVFGKGKKERPVKIGSRAAKAVRFYLMHWRKPAVAREEHVFLTCRGVTREGDLLGPEAGQPLSVNALAHVIKRVGRAAGVPRVHPHLLRHTFACLYLKQHRDPFALKSLLGHTTLAMTNHYCEAVQQMDVIQADAISVIDAIDLHGLDMKRRGRPGQKEQRRG